MVAAGDARRRLDRGQPRELRRLSRALRLRRQVAARAACHRCRAARRRRSAGPDRARPSQSASSRRGPARRAARRAARVRGGGDHPDARGGRDDRVRAGAGSPRSCRIRTSSTGTRCRGRDRRTPALSSGCTPRAFERTWTWRRWLRCSRRRWPGCPARGCGSTSITRCSIPARTRMTRTSGEALRALAAANDRVELLEHDYFSDAELWEYLNAIDVSVLPYRFGTHSGWLEACFDLGTTVVAPSCGFYAEQRPCVTYRHDETGLDAASLAGAVRSAYAQRPGPRAIPSRAARGTPSAGRRPSFALLAVAAMRIADHRGRALPGRRTVRRWAGGARLGSGRPAANAWARSDALRRARVRSAPRRRTASISGGRA